MIGFLIEFITLLILGSAVGFLSAFFGIGGGLIAVPFLLFYYDQMIFPEAIGVSFGIIFLNSILNLMNYWKAGFRANRSVWVPMVPGILAGVLTGNILINSISKYYATLIFSVFLLFTIVKTLMMRPPHSELSEELGGSLAINISFGFLAGLVAAVNGIGGGVIFIPVLIGVIKVSLKDVAAYSNLLMAVVSGIGVFNASFVYGVARSDKINPFPFAQIGNVNFALMLIIFVGAIFTSKLGVNANDRVAHGTKKKLLATLLTLILLKMLASLA